jgi:hypothetical protein
MKTEIERAMREVLEAWEAPKSSSGLNLACAIYQMKRIYMAEMVDHLRGVTKKVGRQSKHSRHNDERTHGARKEGL